MNDKQEPLIVYCFRDDDLGALVLVGRDPFGMIGAGDCIDNADMPEPDVAGLWAWEDDGSEPAYAGIDFFQWEDERLRVGESLVEWRGHWRRPTEAEMRHFTTGQRVRDGKPNVAALEGPGWEPDQDWVSYDGGDGYSHVRPVWVVKGPEPFGGLRCRNEEHASVVCEQLNALAGRTPAPKRVTAEEPNPIAGGLAETVRRFGASGLSVDVTGCTIVLTAVEGAEHE